MADPLKLLEERLKKIQRRNDAIKEVGRKIREDREKEVRERQSRDNINRKR